MKRFIQVLLPLFIFTAAICTAKDKEPIANYEILFSPKDHVAEELIALIEQETTSVKAAVYCIMHNGIAKAMIDAHKRGVNVELIVDPCSIKARCPVRKMAASNLPIYVWDPRSLGKAASANGKKKRHKPLMHDKFCVLGNGRVWTGSFNFTYDGTARNRENVIVLENTSVAEMYLEEFDRLKAAGCVSFDDYIAEK